MAITFSRVPIYKDRDTNPKEQILRLEVELKKQVKEIRDIHVVDIGDKNTEYCILTNEIISERQAKKIAEIGNPRGVF